MTLSKVKQAKFRHYFDMTDANNDGVVTKADFELAAEETRKQLGLTEGTAEAEQLLVSVMSYWESLAQHADVNHDGQIELQEWLDHWGHVVASQEMINQLVGGYGQTVLAVYDRDNDGRLTYEDFSAYYLGHQIPEENCKLAFAKMDADGDSYVDNDEFYNTAMQFFTSDDADAPGNYLFGDFTHYLDN